MFSLIVTRVSWQLNDIVSETGTISNREVSAVGDRLLFYRLLEHEIVYNSNDSLLQNFELSGHRRRKTNRSAGIVNQ